MYNKLSRKISMFLAFVMVMSSIMIGMPSMVRAEETTFVETFDNYSNNPGEEGSYKNGSFIGDNGIEWTYEGGRSNLKDGAADYSIDGKGLMFRKPADGAKISATIQGGIKDFSVDTKRAFTGITNTRELELLINDVSKGKFVLENSIAETQKFVVNDINIEGEFKLEIKHIGAATGAQTTIDNITWTSFGTEIETNLLPNGDFEDWDGDLPVGWSGSKSNIAKISKIENDAQSGNTSLRLEEAGSKHKRFTTQPITLEGGINYTLTYWVKGSGEIRNSYYTSTITEDYGYAKYSDYTLVDSAEWQEIEYTFTNASDAEDLEIIFSVKNTKVESHLQIDNVVLVSDQATEPTEPTNKVASITATPLPGAVAEGTLVTLATVTDAATIYYTIDGQEPTVESITYTEPIAITEALTIKAIAVKDGMDNSDVDTFIYTIKEALSLISTKEVKAKLKGTEVMVKGIATYSTQTRTLFMQDDTGGICIDLYGANLATYVGKEIEVTGITNEYGGMVQVVPKDINGIIITNNDPSMPQPEIITIEELLNTKREHEGKLIKIENAKISVIGTSTSALFNHTIIQDEMETTLRAGALTGRNVGDYITITGVAGYFNSPQIQANVTDIIDGIAPSVEKVMASPASGATLPMDSNVVLSTTTEGATITYTINNGEEITIEENSATVAIKEFNQENNQAIIKAKAFKDGYTTGQSTFAYTQAKAQMVISTPVGAVDGDSQVTLTAGDNATIKYILTIKVDTSEETSNEEIVYTGPITFKEEDLPIKITSYAIEDKYLNSNLATFNYYLKSNKPYKNYFGQLHSHTTNSDGAGTLTEAFAWARDNAKLDFFAVTDHSNSFDTASKDDKAGTYNLGAYNKDNTKWQAGVNAAADAARPNQFISFYGYEMTWSGGPGHMNTFATEGFVSRNNTELNSKTNDAGLRAYYELLKLHPESISQFNHPGTTFGNFSGYAYYDPIVDQRISLIEVGNGEGAIGSGGYFPSYEEYDMALDKGWHLAPTNNQDNHKAKWGNSNTARTVVYTNDFTKEGIYQAMKDMRVYATEDVNLDIVYTLNNEQLGTILDTVPNTATFKVNAKNIAGTNKVRSISIITNGGVEAHKQTFSTSDANLDYVMNAPKAGYYYIKVVQEDGRIAVTAPVWLGKAEAVGISEVKSSASSPVTTEELTLSTTVFNNESTATTINSIKYQIKGGELIADEILDLPVQSSTSTTHTQKFTPTEAKRITIIVTVNMTVNGTVKIFTREIVLNVKDIEKLNFIGIDASHLNEYVAGNYKDSMGNFSEIAMKYGLRTVMLRTSEEFIAATTNPKYQMFVITAPTRRLEPASNHKSYSQDELDAIANFAKQGKTIIVTGWGDFYESYNYVQSGLENHMAGQQNKILQAIGANLRLADDESEDAVNNGGQLPRLYLDDYNGKVSPLLEGILDGQKFSHYGGSTLYAINQDGTPALTLPNSVIPIISGHSTTYSRDTDGDGYGFADPTIRVPRYGDSADAGHGTGKVLLTASETLDHSNGITSQVIVSGGAFMSNFEIKNSALDNPADAYSNENILRNLLTTIENITITPIDNVKTAEEGTEFTIEGIATVSVYDGTSENNTGFFDSIYVQDATSGINLFPVANGVQAGQRIRVTGEVSSYQGEMQLAVSSISIIDEAIVPITPTVVSTKDSMAAINTGKLIKTTGKVINIVAEPTGVINQITIDDGTGAAIVYINAYITPDKSLNFVTTGATISVTGLGSIGENFTSETDFLPRIRVRDRSEIEFVSAKNDNPDKDDSDDNNDVINPPVVVPPTKPEVVDNKIEMTPKLSGSGAYKATLSTQEVNTIIEKVLKDTVTNSKGIIEINAIAPTDAQSVTVSIPASGIQSIADNNKTSLKIDTGMISMTLDEKTVDAISKAGSKGDVEISVQAVAPATLSAETLTIVGTRPVYDINIMSDGKKISDFDGGKVFVSIPYTLKSNENTDLLVLFYINADGELNYVRSSYNEKTKCIEAVLDHFSVYAVAYNKVDFKDVPTSAWYAKAVDFIASRRITLGIGNDNFGPLEKLTREQFLVMMMKAYNITPDAMAIDNFDDVGSNYATLYISTAKHLGITNGLGDNKFAPTKQISRQEMFVMAYNALKVIGELPVAKGNLSIKGYDDLADVADWALPAMTLMIESGLSTGTGNNKLSPLSISDRANMAQVIYNLLK